MKSRMAVTALFAACAAPAAVLAALLLSVTAGIAAAGQSEGQSEEKQMTYRGRWFGDDVYFGMHYDIHANASDTSIGERCTPEELQALLEIMGPQWVQTDCKGHPGMTSWLSKVANATVSPGVRKDALNCWREATRRMGAPLICHYSGIWDIAASEKHPEWAVVLPEQNIEDDTQEDRASRKHKMCPRSGYLEGLVIPQMKELIDRYGVDGFWVDGDMWAVEYCYCDRCKAAWREKTGIEEPPVDRNDPNWIEWRKFTRAGFDEYVSKYVEAIHAYKPGVLVCSNWLQTFSNPGEPRVMTDWISGDNNFVWGYDGSRVEARFISTRGKPWDIMLWNFYASHGFGQKDSPWEVKPPEMLMQEAAVTLALGGRVQIYENPMNVRDGRLIPWHMERLRKVADFCKMRKTFCLDTTTIPQVAVLHSEAHHYNQVGRNLHRGYSTENVRGAVESILEASYGVDVLDEWALLPRAADFPIIVAAEEQDMSDEAVGALKDYVRNGGCLLVTGAESLNRFGEEFLGVKAAGEETEKTHWVPAADGFTQVYSRTWKFLTPTTATPVSMLSSNVIGDEALSWPAAVKNKVGRGEVIYVPFAVFEYFHLNRYPLTRAFVAGLLDSFDLRLAVRVHAPVAVDVVLREKDSRRIIHFINRSSGYPNNPEQGAVAEIPPVGPMTIEMDCPIRPVSVNLAYEDAPLGFDYELIPGGDGGRLTIEVPAVRIHAAVVVKMR